MKNTVLIVSVMSLAVIAAGCKPTEKNPTIPSSATTAQQVEKAQATAKDAAKDMQDYAFAQKTEFVAGMKMKLADLNKSLDELSTKIEGSSAAVKAEAKPKLDALRVQAAALKKQIEAAEGATETTWSVVKTEAQKTYTALKDGFADAVKWVGSKLNP